MTYGPIPGSGDTPLAVDEGSSVVASWDAGLHPTSTTALPVAPRVLVAIETQEGDVHSALIPAGRGRVLVSSVGERVTEYRTVLTGTSAGVYAVSEERADGLVVWEIVVHNGVVDLSRQTPWLGCLRFAAVQVSLVTPGWTASPIDVGARGDWYLGSRVGFARRFVCWRDDDPTGQARGLALAALTDLRIPDPVPAIGAARFRLHRGMSSRHDPLYASAPRLGPLFYDTTIANGFETGDRGLDPIGGWECSEDAARSYASDLTRILSRHGCAVADAITGDPVWPERWPHRWIYKLIDGRYAVDDWNWGSASGAVVGAFGWNRKYSQGPREVNPGPCATRQLVLSTMPHDEAHLDRVTTAALAAWQLCRSWTARWILRMSACDVMLSYDPSPGGSLAGELAWAATHPGKGSGYLRATGRVMRAVAAALSLTPVGPERSRYLAWRASFLQLMSLSCLPNGFARDGTKVEYSDNGEPWTQGLPAEFGSCAEFQLSIWTNALHELWVNGPPTQAVPKGRYEWMMTTGLQQVVHMTKSIPGAGMRSPPTHMGVSKGGVAENPITVGSTTFSYSGHFNHDLHGMCLAAIATGNDRFRLEQFRSGTTFQTPEAQLASWRAHPSAWTALPVEMKGAVV